MTTDGVTDRQLQDAAEAFARGDVAYLAGEPADLPPRLEAEPTVTRGVRLPVSLDERARAAAENAGMTYSALLRQWIELGLTEMEGDQTISLAAVRRAIAHAAQKEPGRAA